MARRRPTVPFKGTPPAVVAGDAIEIRDAYADWWPAVAMSAPRYDQAHAAGRSCFLTVSVRLEDGETVNWPAEDVRAKPDPGEIGAGPGSTSPEPGPEGGTE